jgi:hypothetical protein
MNVLRVKDKEMRRLRKLVENALIDTQENYINTRKEQLREEALKCHDEMDAAWYNRIIQELDWVQQMKSKPTHNCFMQATSPEEQKIYNVRKGMVKE